MNKNWQTIETAPKDGTVIKLLIPYNPDIFTEAECTTVGYWNDLEVLDDEKGCWRFNGDDGPFDIAPTHWQPLEK